MTDNLFHENPIRSKIKMMQNIIEIIRCLHLGKRELAEALIEELKIRSIQLDEPIQQRVLMFVEQVQFQYAYDPWHKITPEVEKAADLLLESLKGER